MQLYSGVAPKHLSAFFLNDHFWPRSQRKIVQRPSCDWKPVAEKNEAIAIESRVGLGDEKSFLFDSPAVSLYSNRGELPMNGTIDHHKRNFSTTLNRSFSLGGLDVEAALSLSKSEYTTQESETKLVVKGVGLSGPNVQPETTWVTRTHSSYESSLSLSVGKGTFSEPPSLSVKLSRFTHHDQHRLKIFDQPFMLGQAGQSAMLFDHPPTPVVMVDHLCCTSTGQQKDLFSLFFRDRQSIGSHQINKTEIFDFVVDDIHFQLDLSKDFSLYRVLTPGLRHKIFSGWANHAHRITIGQTLIGCLPHFDGLVSFDFSGI